MPLGVITHALLYVGLYARLYVWAQPTALSLSVPTRSAACVFFLFFRRNDRIPAGLFTASVWTVSLLLTDLFFLAWQSQETHADCAGWRTFFEACAEGKVLKALQLFRLPLATLMEQQHARLQADLAEASPLLAAGGGVTPLACGVPLILLDCLVQLRAIRIKSR